MIVKADELEIRGIAQLPRMFWFRMLLCKSPSSGVRPSEWTDLRGMFDPLPRASGKWMPWLGIGLAACP